MRSISDTLARMAAFRDSAASSHTDSGHLDTLASFGDNPGALHARFYVPDDLPAGAPLVVALHGCTQTAAGYDHGTGWSTLARASGFAVLFPEQVRANNANLCFNWFVVDDIARVGGEAESIAQMVTAMIAQHGIDPRRVFVTGLSAGGAMTAVMLATYPETFAAGAIIGGLPYGCASSVPEAFDRMRGHGAPALAADEAVRRAAPDHAGRWPKVSIWHGTADATVGVSNVDRIGEQWRAVHAIHGDTPVIEQGADWEHVTWHDADGLPAVEAWRIAGMGHGVPIDPNGPERLGASGAYMLDVGVSSTAIIARSWGLQVRAAAAEPATAPTSPTTTAPRRAPRPRVVPAVNANAGGAQKVIEDALRSAGLMR